MANKIPEDLYVKGRVNSYTDISKILDELFTKMMLYNDSIWKLLTFDNVKIIEHELGDDDTDYVKYEMDIEGNPLTGEQKKALLFKDGDGADNYRIQFQKMIDDALKERQCRIHMYISRILPLDDFKSIISVTFNIVCHNKYNMINGGHRTRIDCISEELKKFFIGMQLDKSIGGIFFNYRQSNNADIENDDLTNSKNFLGNTLTMSFFYGVDEEKWLR